MGNKAILKRGITGVHHHVSKQHLHRDLAKFDRRHNTRKVDDQARTTGMVKTIEGKRLTYKPLVKRPEQISSAK